MAQLSTEEFENKCMDIIEKVVAADKTMSKANATKIAEKMLDNAKAKTGNKSVIAIFERVVKEFNIATEAEYNMLWKQIWEK